MERNYWTRRKVSRRGVVVGSGVVGFGAAGLALVGCGGDDAAPKTGTATAGTAAPGTTATTAVAEQPKRGGTYNLAIGQDIPTIDPYPSASAQTKGPIGYVYSRLFTIESGKPNDSGAAPLKFVGDTAESIEGSADGLKYTVKLKGNVKWHPPISRPMTAEDVVFSWQRFMGKLPGGKPAANSDRLALIANVEAPDQRTVVFTLSKKYGPFPELLADETTLVLMPKETGTAFDPAQAMVGTGPFMFDKYTPGSALSFKRNPDWHSGPDRPYFDRVVLTIIKDADARLNQFLAGNLDVGAANGLTVDRIKKELAGVQLYQRDVSGLVGMFGFENVTTKRTGAPWTDVRVRRAMSMAIDRDELLEVAYFVSKFEKSGFKFPKVWQGYLPNIFADVVVTPKSEASVTKWYTKDAKTAKTMIDEAGGGFSVNMHYSTTYGAEYTSIIELCQKYWADIGVKVNLLNEDYASKFVTQSYRGNFDGMVFAGQAGISDPGSFLQSAFQKAATLNQGHVDDPRVEEALTKYGDEADATKRKAVLIDLQKYLLDQVYYIPAQWGAFIAPTAYAANMRGVQDHASFGYGAAGQDSTYFWKA